MIYSYYPGCTLKNKAQDLDLESGLDYEADQFALLFATEDAREGMNAFGEKRKPEFEGR